MKYRQFNVNLDLIDQEVDGLFEELANHKPTSDEYSKLREQIDGWCETQNRVVKSKAEYLSGKVPQWLVTGFGFVGSLFIGKRLWDKENAGAVISSQAISVWEKLIRRF